MPTMPEDVVLHTFKTPRLAGGTLVASLPSSGVGSILLTDYLLEQASMDHVASADSNEFPPVAMVHEGKPRFPIRIHADEATRLCLLRSEIPTQLFLLRSLARQTIAWAKAHKLARIVALDGVTTRDGGGPDMYFVCNRKQDSDLLAKRGIVPLQAGVLGGFTACLLLESRLQDVEVVALLATLRDAESDVRSCLRFAEVLPAFVPQLKVDRQALEKELGGLEQAIRSLHAQAERAMKRIEQRDRQPPQEFV